MATLREVCFLIGNDDTILWVDASTIASSLPDSRLRWREIWERRSELVEVAHSHPAGGAFFSDEDETTMMALDSALGRRLLFSVITPDSMIRRTRAATASRPAMSETVSDEPWWVDILRLASGIEPEAMGQMARGASRAQINGLVSSTGESDSQDGKEE